MFSGIIHTIGTVKKRDANTFRIQHTLKKPIKIGDSIAHDGACMSVTNIGPDWYEFFVMAESFNKTQLDKNTIGDTINIEQSISYGDQLDGHILSGHIDTTGQISKIEEQQDGSKDIWIEFSEEFSRYTIKKGWIAINGVSLTIVDEGAGRLQVSIIPLTAQKTNIGSLRTGDVVNLEFDEKVKIIGNILEKMLPETIQNNPEILTNTITGK